MLKYPFFKSKSHTTIVKKKKENHRQEKVQLFQVEIKIKQLSKIVLNENLKQFTKKT